MDNFSKVMVILLLLVLVFTVAPLLLLVGVNMIGSAAVAGFAVPYTLKSWFGAFLIILLLGASGKS